MQVGYNKAVKRYSKSRSYNRGDLFKSIEVEADKFIKEMEEGDQFRISVSLKKMKAVFTEVYRY